MEWRLEDVSSVVLTAQELPHLLMSATERRNEWALEPRVNSLLAVTWNRELMVSPLPNALQPAICVHSEGFKSLCTNQSTLRLPIWN